MNKVTVAILNNVNPKNLYVNVKVFCEFFHFKTPVFKVEICISSHFEFSAFPKRHPIKPILFARFKCVVEELGSYCHIGLEGSQVN